MKTDLMGIEKLTSAYAGARGLLSEEVRALESEIAEARKKHIGKIKRLAVESAARKQALKTAIEDSPDLFKKPKSRIFANIKVGFRKLKGKLAWADEGRVLKTIKKYFPDQADILIRTKETPNKEALATYPADFLRRCSITITEDSDVVCIEPVDSEIEKLVDALLKDATGKEAAKS